MKRSLFLQLPLVASALIANARSQDTGSTGRTKKGIKVEAKKDRFQEELLLMGGQFDCKVSGKDTNGDLCVYDTYRQEKGGPALHMHHSQDEWFFVVRGEFIVQVGDDRFQLKPGDSVLAPRKVPHAFAKISEGEAQVLILFQPAGMMEDFFLQMSKVSPSIVKDQERLAELWRSHGMEMLGPPLKY